MCYGLVAFVYLIFLLFNFHSVLQTIFSESKHYQVIYVLLKEFMFYIVGLLLQDPLDPVLHSCSLFFFFFLVRSFCFLHMLLISSQMCLRHTCKWFQRMVKPAITAFGPLCLLHGPVMVKVPSPLPHGQFMPHHLQITDLVHDLFQNTHKCIFLDTKETRGNHTYE